jgi:hypothetical protein
MHFQERCSAKVGLSISAMPRLQPRMRGGAIFREGPTDLYGVMGVKAFRYWPSPCSAGLRHLLVPTCFLPGCCAERPSRVAEGHRGSDLPLTAASTAADLRDRVGS